MNKDSKVQIPQEIKAALINHQNIEPLYEIAFSKFNEVD